MSRVLAGLLFVTLPWRAVLAAEPAIPTHAAKLLDDRADQTVRRTYVPDATRRVGEVRLVKRGGARVVQTLLYTKILKRAVGEIRKKETANWPPGAPGHDAAARYLEALSQAQNEIWLDLPKGRPAANVDRRQKLLIEFAVDGESAIVALGRYELDESAGEVRVRDRRIVSLLELSRAYVERNMQLIAADAYGVAPQETPALWDDPQ